jgi:rhodanese-related sulfurtransferase
VTQSNDIDARTLRDMLERGERVTLVDVRKREQHEAQTIPGSVSFDAYDALHAGDERAMEGLELLDGERVVTFCNRGTSGAVPAEQLRRRGYEAYSLEGGLEAWKDLQRARV